MAVSLNNHVKRPPTMRSIFNSIKAQSRRTHLSFVLVFLLLVVTFQIFRHNAGYETWDLERLAKSSDIFKKGPFKKIGLPCRLKGFSHPIDELRCRADRDFKALLSKQTKGLSEAAQAYRLRRGRHPPPWFDKWVQYAEENDALMIEELFDQIYHDLEPFWGVPTQRIRDFSRKWNTVVSFRNGTGKRFTNEPDVFFKMTLHWLDMLNQLPHGWVPDVDMAFSIGDEPRVLVSWEEIESYMKIAEEQKSVEQPYPLKGDDFVNDFAKYEPIPDVMDPVGYKFEEEPVHLQTWDLVRRTCPPDSETRSTPLDSDLTAPIDFPKPEELPHMFQGFVRNWTASQRACENPKLGNVHGTFIAMQITDFENPTFITNGNSFQYTSLVPIFAGCKIAGANNEILVPAAIYWPLQGFGDMEGAEGFLMKDEYTTKWDDKKDIIFWRGSASGGWNNETNWTRFQRHRLISMLNGTQISAEQAAREAGKPVPAHLPGGDPPMPHNFPWPDQSVYDLSALKKQPSDVGKWIGDLSDAAFRDLRCYMPYALPPEKSGNCTYAGPYYTVVPSIEHGEDFKYKYQPDIDGATFSGRYLSLIESKSVPIKATIFSEWHDSRLIPWRHFVPMDNFMGDFWALLEYFLGYKSKDRKLNKKPHSVQGREIALQGREWVGRALRKEDMVIYMFRLVLEFARISDDNRLVMGYVDDLL